MPDTIKKIDNKHQFKLAVKNHLLCLAKTLAFKSSWLHLLCLKHNRHRGELWQTKSVCWWLLEDGKRKTREDWKDCDGRAQRHAPRPGHVPQEGHLDLHASPPPRKRSAPKAARLSREHAGTGSASSAKRNARAEERFLKRIPAELVCKERPLFGNYSPGGPAGSTQAISSDSSESDALSEVASSIPPGQPDHFAQALFGPEDGVDVGAEAFVIKSRSRNLQSVSCQLRLCAG